jgi:hypothetical protein
VDLPVGPVVSSVDGVEVDPDLGVRRDVPSTRAPGSGDGDA